MKPRPVNQNQSITYTPSLATVPSPSPIKRSWQLCQGLLSTPADLQCIIITLLVNKVPDQFAIRVSFFSSLNRMLRRWDTQFRQRTQLAVVEAALVLDCPNYRHACYGQVVMLPSCLWIG